MSTKKTITIITIITFILFVILTSINSYACTGYEATTQAMAECSSQKPKEKTIINNEANRSCYYECDDGIRMQINNANDTSHTTKETIEYVANKKAEVANTKEANQTTQSIIALIVALIFLYICLSTDKNKIKIR